MDQESALKRSRQERWVAALRSGEYKQGTRYLNQQGSFCCLGVACDLFKDELGLKLVHNIGCISYNGARSVLPQNVADYLGLKSLVGFMRYDRTLATLNDRGASFNEIADIIEKERDVLFENPSDL